MKKVLVLVLGLFLIACGSDEKKKTEPVVKDEKKTEKEEVSAKFPKVEKKYPALMTVIYDDGYLFDDDVQLEEISVVASGEKDTYDIILSFDDKTNFDKLQEYGTGIVFYPKDPSKLADKADRDAKKKKTGKKVEIQMLDNEYVVIVNDFKIVPKELSSVKLYFYNKQGVLKDNFLKIREVVLP